MAFGQAAGPPASAKQLEHLAALLADAGYDSFKEARHPFALNQRQAGGRFTGAEASELIEQLEAGEGAEGPEADEPPPTSRVPKRAAPPPPPAARRPAARRPARPAAPPSGSLGGDAEVGAGDVVTAFPDELLAEELVRRGWTCTPPA